MRASLFLPSVPASTTQNTRQRNVYIHTKNLKDPWSSEKTPHKIENKNKQKILVLRILTPGYGREPAYESFSQSIGTVLSGDFLGHARA